jgi:predicted enzyme related to lactoylglutathione lyase
MVQGLRTLIYNVDDLEKAKAWYAAVLGHEPYFDQPFYVGFNVGGFELGLDPDMSGVTRGNSETGYWGVENIESAFERIKATGAEVAAEVTEVGGGIKFASFKDPSGNTFAIIENPHFVAEA